ncbi:MAG: ribosome assembly RNA-binding protein YhbY [Bacteroidales bacterium]|nr:ribosome assembly RNA-binding protein YhbY [Lachnoclostridium sp.]MCM1382960.1 ribosome assembly RNA-binding protein YhbY [Lachnoclostridium sp.]MCM1463987.1 ribosome assembly RNA-binding protein YhbY [Bacteroidales bacterium]
MELNSKQRAYLKSLASNLTPVFQIGKASLTPEVTNAIEECFHNNELIKIAVLKNCLEEPVVIADTIAGRTRSEVVHVMGRKIVLYRPDKDKPRIELPKK